MKELDHKAVLSILPDRQILAHKGNFGRILLLCGSRGYTGAAYLAAMGALRTGAGLTYLGVPESIYAIEAVKLNEPIVFPLPDDDGKLAVSAAEEIKGLLPKMDAALIGKPLVFYAFDLDKYASDRSFYFDYESYVPGPVVKSFDELIATVSDIENLKDNDKLKRFREFNFGKPDGKATEKVVDTILK